MTPVIVICKFFKKAIITCWIKYNYLVDNWLIFLYCLIELSVLKKF